MIIGEIVRFICFVGGLYLIYKAHIYIMRLEERVEKLESKMEDINSTLK